MNSAAAQPAPHDFDYDLLGLDLEAESVRLQRALEHTGPVAAVGEPLVELSASEIPF